jgi:hypothetical protein
METSVQRIRIFRQYDNSLFSQHQEYCHHCSSREHFLHSPRRHPSLLSQSPQLYWHSSVCMLVRRWGNRSSFSSLESQFPTSVRCLSFGMNRSVDCRPQQYTSRKRRVFDSFIHCELTQSHSFEMTMLTDLVKLQVRLPSILRRSFHLGAPNQPLSTTYFTLTGTLISDGLMSSLIDTPRSRD